MNNAKKEVSRELGLEIGVICGKYFLKLKHLHYGYWTGDIELDVTNLRFAQDEYAKFVISHIPDGVKTILDVGCGTGQIAKKLTDMGYRVDCVSPSGLLKKQAGELLGNKSRIFECLYENLQTDNRYDIIFFCESFQYIDMEKALSNTANFLNNGGYLLICDIFKKDVNGKGAMGGGHKLTKFYDIIKEAPFRLIEELDITEQTAPNMDLLNDALKNAVEPAANLGVRFLENRYPTAFKLLKWIYRKRIDKIHKKYLSGSITGEDFKKYRSYLLFLYKKDVQE